MSFRDLEAGRPLPSRRETGNGSRNQSQAVAAAIFQVNTSVFAFKRLVNILGTPKDTPEHRDKLHKTRQQIGQLVKETTSKLRAASDTDQHMEVGESRTIADAKLAKDFQAVLKEFQQAQLIAAERETSYTPFVPQAVLPFSDTSSEFNLSPDINQEHQALLAEQKRQEVRILENEVVFNEAIIEEREQGIKEIQEQIEGVNEIFKDLAVLVDQQRVIIDDIDSNIESSYAATVQANTQLAKASKSQKSNKWLICLLLIILGVVLLVVIIVLVV